MQPVDYSEANFMVRNRDYAAALVTAIKTGGLSHRG